MLPLPAGKTVAGIVAVDSAETGIAPTSGERNVAFIWPVTEAG